jgi:hypothetical protein
MSLEAIAAVDIAPRVGPALIDGFVDEEPLKELGTAERACEWARVDALWYSVPFVVVPMRGVPFTPAVLDLEEHRQKRRPQP